MSFLIHQTEVNDCGVAICTMVLKQINVQWSLEQFKVEHQYNHQQYSFQIMKDLLARHGVKAYSYEFDNLVELQEINGLSCFQIVNQWGQLHFILGRFLNHQRWLIYDPARLSSQVWSTKELLAHSTKKVQIYELPKIEKVQKSRWRIFKMLIKNNFFSMLVNNFILLLNLTILVIANSFLRIIFQDFQFITLQRTFLLTIALICLIVLNGTFNYLTKKLNLLFANKFFQKLINQENFQIKFEQGKEYLHPLDLERSYFQFQTNVLSLITIINQLVGLMLFGGFLSYYFFKTNQILFLSSILLTILLSVLKLFKLKLFQKQSKVQQLNQNLYLNEFKLLVKNTKAIMNKTTLKNYFELKGLNHLLLFKLPKLSESFHFFERFLIYFYYLILCLLLNWQNQSISLLIIFTSMTIVVSSQIEQLISSLLTYKNENYFNQLLFTSLVNLPKINHFHFTFKKHLLNENFLVINESEINQLLINDLPIKNFKSKIYFANESINFNETVYFNVFNYEFVNWKIFNQERLNELLEKQKISLEDHVNENNQEMVKYLSCYFARQEIIILNLPQDDDLVKKIITCFQKKMFIFLKNES